MILALEGTVGPPDGARQAGQAHRLARRTYAANFLTARWSRSWRQPDRARRYPRVEVEQAARDDVVVLAREGPSQTSGPPRQGGETSGQAGPPAPAPACRRQTSTASANSRLIQQETRHY